MMLIVSPMMIDVDQPLGILTVINRADAGNQPEDEREAGRGVLMERRAEEPAAV